MLTSKFLVYRQHPSQAQIWITSGVAATLFLTFVVTLFFSRQPLPRIEAFLPVVNTTLVVGYLSTATLLFAQARALRFRPLYLLGAAYFFNGLMTIARCLTFPGTFAAHGLLGARADTALWLGNAGLSGFSVAILAYSRISQRASQAAQSPSHSALGLYLIVTVAIALLVMLLAASGGSLLPLLVTSQGHWEPALYIVASLTLLLTAAAMVALLLGRRPVLDLWLLVVLWSQFLETLLVLLSSGRFSDGWYVGQVMGMLSGLFVYFALLAETNSLYGLTVDQLKAERREQESRLLIREAAAASIAHELRQPLAAIMLNAQVGQRSARPDDQEASVLFKEIEEASRRANDTIQSTRSLFAHSPAAMQASDVNELIRNSLALVSRDLKDHAVSVDLKLVESLAPVAANQLQMQEVFLNLFTNAMEAMSGQVGKPRILTISSSSADGGVVICVQDTGPGFADGEIEQVFTPFFTTKKSGTGVGLTVCHSIVSAHAGSLRAMRANAGGAAFEIYLPYNGASAGVETGHASSPSTAIPPSGTLRQVPRPVDKVPATLGDVLYAKSKTPVQERVWARLVQSIAAGDQLALHELYEMAHRIVFALILQITANRETSEELTIDVFHDVWRGASRYDAANGTVLAWIMNQARSRAIDRLLFENREKRSHGIHVHAEMAADAQGHLALRIAQETGKEAVPPPSRQWCEPEWEQVAPGIECKLLATDTERHRVSMLVRLAPGASYPAHTHAGVEELHLLDGELWIDERKLFPGDYNYGAPGAGDDRVWSETGCTCVLVTSTKDVLRV